MANWRHMNSDSCERKINPYREYSSDTRVYKKRQDFNTARKGIERREKNKGLRLRKRGKVYKKHLARKGLGKIVNDEKKDEILKKEE